MKGIKISIEHVRNSARVVFQDFIKLLLTIRENVALGDIKKMENDKDLYGALMKSDAHKFIENINDSVGTQFGGRDFSGGQWQKIALSRAYLSECLLTIFDEPTSSLDPQAELETFQSFMKLSENRTSIIVTHRLAIAKEVDKIFVLKEGRIVEMGNHEKLMKLSGEYKKMYDLQSAMYM